MRAFVILFALIRLLICFIHLFIHLFNKYLLIYMPEIHGMAVLIKLFLTVTKSKYSLKQKSK